MCLSTLAQWHGPKHCEPLEGGPELHLVNSLLGVLLPSLSVSFLSQGCGMCFYHSLNSFIFNLFSYALDGKEFFSHTILALCLQREGNLISTFLQFVKHLVRLAKHFHQGRATLQAPEKHFWL